MRRCPNCDFENDALRKSCGACGADLKDAGTGPSRSAQVGRTSAARSSAPYPLDMTDEHRVLSLLRQDRKIEAIKLHRDVTGGGLKESKEAVEALAAAHGIKVRVKASGLGCLLFLAVVLGFVGLFVFQLQS